jgi:hypothetical protein
LGGLAEGGECLIANEIGIEDIMMMKMPLVRRRKRRRRTRRRGRGRMTLVDEQYHIRVHGREKTIRLSRDPNRRSRSTISQAREAAAGGACMIQLRAPGLAPQVRRDGDDDDDHDHEIMVTTMGSLPPK